MMKIYAIVVLSAFAVLGILHAEDDHSAAIEAALQSAQNSLKLIDEGRYAESWQQAADIIKGLVTEEKWASMMKAVREPLGKIKSRKVISKQYMTSLPGAPDGNYVVIQFETSFENKAAAIETFTPMLEKDGQWRMSGYYIK
jgi:hypothetical protein